MYPIHYQKEICCSVDEASGHLVFFDPEHPLARQNGMVSMGRHVLSVKLGRWLGAEECVHYVDGNTQNVEPDNLVLVTAHRTWKNALIALIPVVACIRAGLKYRQKY